MNGETSRVYLDNAATSWPKPPGVLESVADYVRGNGAPAGRSVYRHAQETERLVRSVRRLAAQIVGGVSAEGVVFTANGTDSLNLAIHGVLREGDHVVTTAAEHNSVLRPIEFWRRNRRAQVDVVNCDADGRVDPAAVVDAIRPETRLVAVTAASNVTGTVNELDGLAEAAHRVGAWLLVDAAQLLGHAPFDAAACGADLVAGSAHKGLLGLLGLGVLWARPDRASEIVPLRQGGSGIDSASPQPPRELPARLEAGNLNVPGIAALGAGIEYLLERGIEQLAAHEAALRARLCERLAAVQHVHVLAAEPNLPTVGVVSFTMDAWEPQEAATLLDLHFGVECRAGLHCAPHIHRRLGTFDRGGTIRFSLGPFTTESDIDRAADAVAELAKG